MGKNYQLKTSKTKVLLDKIGAMIASCIKNIKYVTKLELSAFFNSRYEFYTRALSTHACLLPQKYCEAQIGCVTC